MHTTQQILQALLPMALGLALRLVGLFGDREGVVLRSFVVRFTVPLFVFFSVYGARPESIAALAPMAGAFVLMTALLFGVGWLASRLVNSAPRKTAVHACITFGNYGWMGLGVMAAMLGEPGTQRVVYFIMPWWLVFYGFGLPIGFIHTRRQKEGVPVRRALLVAAPPLAALALGLSLNVGEVPIPGLVEEVLRPFADMTVPLILLSVGLMLDVGRLHRAAGPALLVTAATLLIGPLIGWAVAGLLARDAVTRSTIILEGAMPVATLTPILEENYAMDKDLVSTAIVLSTALSIVTIPVVAALVIP
ncbi:MAG: AEC family transporter [Candidatus Brocadiia bacterium]